MAVLIRRKSSLLSYDPALVPAGGSQFVAACAAPVKQQGKDAAGHVFHAIARRQSGHRDDDEESSEAAAGGKAEQAAGPKTPALEDQPPPGTEYKSKGKKKKKKSERPDYYALIGLKHERWMATDAQMKNGYRRACLEHHPDKAGAATADDATKLAIEDNFKQIQEAYDTLSDPQRRREYDSVDDFDDSLPFDCAAADFYKVFGPAFRRNSRWSVQQPVPEVGGDEAAWDLVEAFYDFWFTFRSWREFPHPDEEDTEQAECREERRWIERFNSKLREAAKKDEKRRLKEFVEAAYARDPRVARHREEERAQRDRRKQEKAQAARAKQEAEEARVAAEAAERAAADAAAAEEAAGAKKQREREKKQMQQQRKRIRTACSGLGHEQDDVVEVLCHALPLQGLSELADALSEEGLSQQQQCAVLQEHRSHVDDSKAVERAAQLASASPAASSKAAAKRKAEAGRAARQDWQPEELRMLEKALAKFPQGTAKRWDQVAGYVRTRSVEEVLDMAKHGLKGGINAPHKNGVTIASKRQGNTQINSEATQRLEAFTDVEVNLRDTAGSQANGHLPNGPTSNGFGAASTAAPAQAPEAQRPATPPEASGSSPAPAQPAPGKAASGEAWSEAQELALVQAMKRFGKEMDDRWERVAEQVPGKSHRQCLKRFKELRTSFKAKKVAT